MCLGKKRLGWIICLVSRLHLLLIQQKKNHLTKIICSGIGLQLLCCMSLEVHTQKRKAQKNHSFGSQTTTGFSLCFWFIKNKRLIRVIRSGIGLHWLHVFDSIKRTDSVRNWTGCTVCFWFTKKKNTLSQKLDYTGSTVCFWFTKKNWLIWVICSETRLLHWFLCMLLVH